MNMNDLVGTWEVPLYDKIHKIQFEHGTTTGRRVLWIDGEIVSRKEWMFKLVGSEPFEIKNPDNNNEIVAKCEIIINACLGFTYEYILYVNGKQFKTFREKQSKIMRAWHFDLKNDDDNGNDDDTKEKKQFRVVLEKDTLDVWVNGQKKETTNEFGDSEGTEITFDLTDEYNGCIKTISSGDKRKGMIYVLEVNGKQVEEIEPEVSSSS
ncbi:fas apoptotic inhibitory molecule 1 [Dermatophagoides pteronyssinus]|uniref:fas apoptotic inhibitory molecule 1 n=1 Tax=Dermatophagoides pteronyssinus TaxID=6956 RepID=UPI003F66FDBD